MSDTNTIKRVNFWLRASYQIVSDDFKSGSYYEIVDQEGETVVNDIHSETDAQHHLKNMAIASNTPVYGYGDHAGKTFEQLPKNLQAEICRMATV